MHEQPQIEIGSEPPARGPSSFAFLVAAAAVVIIVIALYLWPGRRSPSEGAPQGQHFPFGAVEAAYASRITIEGLGLSRAENFLNQEVTILSGELVNSGDRELAGVELTVEYFDEMNQIALRESRPVVEPPKPAVSPREHRKFELSFEHLPSSWNMQMPTVRVTGLVFASAK